MLSLQTVVLSLALAGAGQGETVLLDFSATWCGPCREMEPVIQQLAAKGYPVKKIDFDTNRALAAQYGVDRLPSFVMIVAGKEVAREIGYTDLGRLEQMCQMGLAARSNVQPVSHVAEAEPATLPIASVPEMLAGTLPLGTNQWSPIARPGSSPDAQSIAATVRLRIEDPDGYSCGTGTIIDSRDGQALILTCGHIFRDSQGQGRIEVDLFGPTPAENIPGQLLSYDLDRDLGLLSIHVPGPVTAAPVAPTDYRVTADSRVVSVGCNNGDLPTAQHSRVTSMDKYMGPPNLQVAGMPVQGRSGGGLFSADGYVIGVCNAADPEDREGLYAALPSIHAMLDRANLANLYRPGQTDASSATALARTDPPAMPRQMPDPRELVHVPTESTFPGPPLSAPASPDRWQQLNDMERNALEEIGRRKAEGAEVICIIRSRNDPSAPSEVLVLDKVSPAFLEQLASQSRPQGDENLTSLEVPHQSPIGNIPRPNFDTRGAPGTPLLEYRAERLPVTTASGLPGWRPQWQAPDTIRR